jgi:hypothetical protein
MNGFLANYYLIVNCVDPRDGQRISCTRGKGRKKINIKFVPSIWILYPILAATRKTGWLLQISGIINFAPFIMTGAAAILSDRTTSKPIRRRKKRLTNGLQFGFFL